MAADNIVSDLRRLDPEGWNTNTSPTAPCLALEGGGACGAEEPCPTPCREFFLFMEDNISELLMRSDVSPIRFKIAGVSSLSRPRVSEFVVGDMSGLVFNCGVFGEMTRSLFSSALCAVSSEVGSSL